MVHSKYAARARNVEEGEKRPKIAERYFFGVRRSLHQMLQPELCISWHELKVVIFLSILCPGISSSHPYNGSDTKFIRRVQRQVL